MYLDSAYLAKFYVNERDSREVRRAIGSAHSFVSSIWAIAEVTCVFHRHVREGSITPSQANTLVHRFLSHIEDGTWRVVPVTERLLRRVSLSVAGLPAEVYLRAGDAVHLTTAADEGESEIWTNDRHLLAAAPHFGLRGRSV